MSEEQLQIIRECMADEPVEDDGVWPENENVVKLFYFMSSQWESEIAPNGRLYRKRLMYECLDNPLKALGLTLDEELMVCLKIMEKAALEVINE